MGLTAIFYTSFIHLVITVKGSYLKKKDWLLFQIIIYKKIKSSVLFWGFLTAK